MKKRSIFGIISAILMSVFAFKVVQNRNEKKNRD